jgi:hypothetical protein
MPVERSNSGSTTITGNAILGMRARALLLAMETHIKSAGAFRLTRHVSPARMRDMATEFTGKRYARSQKGLAQAYADLQQLCDGKSLDQIGEVRAVNETVGGIAADLAPEGE